MGSGYIKTSSVCLLAPWREPPGETSIPNIKHGKGCLSDKKISLQKTIMIKGPHLEADEENGEDSC